MTRRPRAALHAVVVSLVLGVLPIPVTRLGSGVADAAPITFTESFTGAPSSPAAWNPDNWDVSVHSRDLATWDRLLAMQADHGSDCAGPPAKHATDTYAGAVFQCKDHVMTSLFAEGYGVTYLTPNHMVDFSDGEAVVSFDISTLRTSRRDWWDVWISPMGSSLQLPLDPSLPDLSGPPEDAVLVTLGDKNELQAKIYRDFDTVQFPSYPYDRVPGNWSTGYDAFLTPDAARRDKVEIRISQNHLKVGMPAYNFWWVDQAIPTLGWDMGVVQFGHHSYNPAKDCGALNEPGPDGACRPNTWHWDNVSIAPAAPFSIVKGDLRTATPETPKVQLAAPAPAGAHLRFAGIGTNLQVRFDGGPWQNVTRQLQSVDTASEHFASYWTTIPAKTRTIEFKGSNWWGGPWRARDISVWSGTTAATFRATNPQRLADSRLATAAAAGLDSPGFRAAGSVSEIVVAGRGGIATTATTAVLNVTVTEPSGPGFLTVYPCGTTRPLSASLTYAAGQTVGNAVFAKLGTDGKVCVYTHAATHLVVDAAGYFPPPAAFTPLTPARLLETRPTDGPTIDGAANGIGLRSAGSVTELTVAGRGGVGAQAAAVALNVASTGSLTPGYLTVYPCGAERPGAANLTYPPGATVANSVVAKVGSGGKICIFTLAATHIVVDVTGWFPMSDEYTPTSPQRLLETRTSEQIPTVDGLANRSGRRAADSVIELQVTGRAGVSNDASAVVLNLAVVAPQGAGFVTVYPCGTARPLTASANYAAGDIRSNLVVAKIGTGGKVCIYTLAATDLVVDLNGTFGPTI